MTAPRKAENLPSIEYLRTRLRYESCLDKFYWIRCDSMPTPWNNKFEGKEALFSTDKHGYKYGRILNKAYFAHRVVWAFCYNEWPEKYIDHIDGNKKNNLITNLRVVDQKENCKNRAIGEVNNSGVMGVYQYSRDLSWRAQIKIDRKTVYLGSFWSIEEAIKARKDAERKYGFHPNHGRLLQ